MILCYNLYILSFICVFLYENILCKFVKFLASRAESGDPAVTTDYVKDALFIAAGSDPYKLLQYSFAAGLNLHLV